MTRFENLRTGIKWWLHKTSKYVGRESGQMIKAFLNDNLAILLTDPDWVENCWRGYHLYICTLFIYIVSSIRHVYRLLLVVRREISSWPGMIIFSLSLSLSLILSLFLSLSLSLSLSLCQIIFFTQSSAFIPIQKLNMQRHVFTFSDCLRFDNMLL